MMYDIALKDLLSVFAVDSPSIERVTKITLDSREVCPGTVFFACKGHASDGRNFMLEAQQAGALAIVYEAVDAKSIDSLKVPHYAITGLGEMVGHAANLFYKEPSQELQVFGVTGTNGKTTCCYLLMQALAALGMNVAMIGTLGIGTLEKLSDSGMTTPDPISVHKALAEFRDEGVTQVCMEVSSHALDQGRVNGVQFFCSLFTNLSRDHLDYHGDMAQYGLAKQRLFTDFHSELVITNAADKLGGRLVDVANSDFVVQYGNGGDVFADDVRLEASGIHLVVEGSGVEFEIQTPLIGKVNIPNIEMLVSTLLALSTDITDIQRVLSDISPAPGRMELYANPSSPSVVVDYAHTPDALEKALLSIVEHCRGRVWCVFGCGGDRDSGKRSLMGALAEKYSDHAIITNDNPRTERPEDIAEDIASGMTESNFDVILDRGDAIHFAISSAEKEDWVLVAGKGHETTQALGSNTVLFSDRQQVSQVIATMSPSEIERTES